MEKIYYDTLSVNDNKYVIACSDLGLMFVGIENKYLEEINLFFKDIILEKNKSKVASYKRELRHYFSGQEFNFNFPLDIRGTDFQKKVWQELMRINYGRLVSYKYIAEKIGREESVRAVANAIGRNPISIVIPCHRVIGSNGRLTGYRSGLAIKKKLLKLEQSLDKVKL